MPAWPPLSTLIIEPNAQLQTPYSHLPALFPVTRVQSSPQALLELAKPELPGLVLLSTSFSAKQQLNLLESLKQSSRGRLIPLIAVVDLSRPLSVVPGTTWGGQFGLLHSLSNLAEVRATLKRVLAKS